MPKVIIDAAHGGNDVGFIYNNRAEKDDNLRLALQVGKILEEEYGYDVVYTRVSDVYRSQLERAKIINDNGGDLLISFTRMNDPTYNNRGSLNFFIPVYGGDSEEIANKIIDNLKELFFDYDSVLLRTEIPILRDTKIPAVVAGIGNINSDEDNKMFDTYFDEIAEVIAQSIVEVLSKTPEEDVKSTMASNSNWYKGGLWMSQSSRRQNQYSVQVGLFFNYNNALETMTRLFRQGYPAEISKIGGLYAVTVGSFEYLDDAVILERRLRRDGYNTLIITT